MKTIGNKCVTVAYKLYTVGGSEKELFEETNAEHLFQLTSGSGTTFKNFENQITAPFKGDRFDFTIPADEAYGAHDKQCIFDLSKNIFEIDGKFDSECVTEGSTAPLMIGDDQRISTSVVETKPDVVIIGLNHPSTGTDPILEGEVIKSRPATNEEVQELVRMISGEGRGCGCNSCGSDCGDGYSCEGGHCH